MSQPEHDHDRIEALLDLLAEEVAERLKVERAPADLPAIPPMEPPGPNGPTDGVAEVVAPISEPSSAAAGPAAVDGAESPSPDAAIGPDANPDLPEAQPAVYLSPPGVAARQMMRLALGLLIAIVLINIPLNAHGLTIATAMPDSAALVIRDGLLVKELDASDIYVYQQEKFRWITSLDAFEHYGYQWRNVHDVEPGFLDRYQIGAPLHVLLKCDGGPHIYRAERGEKRWIVDIQALVAEGHAWEDVRFVPCSQLRAMPDGETIPPGQGPPPQP